MFTFPVLCVWTKCEYNAFNIDVSEGHKNSDWKQLWIKFFSKDFENIIASHNGYQNRYGYIHERSIKFVKKEKIFLGIDNLIKNRKASNISYGIRFHIGPGIKMVKTQNSQSVLLSLKNGEGWKFSCHNKEVLIEKGIYLGNKNKIIENENIYISGMTNGENQIIEWSFEKIS